MKWSKTAILALCLTGWAWANPAPAPPDTSDRAGAVLEQRYRAAAEAGVKEGLPVRTINARPQGGLDRLAPPPEPGTGIRMRVQAYAYCLNGYTARGTRVQLGTVAVDPGTIPLGSLLYIPGYGWGRALDTGGAIQGRKVDLWFPTLGQCLQWGVRPVEIVVFPPER
ncbi:MAG: 3D domain-containing protein [Candidatus Eremiobacterota bacterium]